MITDPEFVAAIAQINTDKAAINGAVSSASLTQLNILASDVFTASNRANVLLSAADGEMQTISLDDPFASGQDPLTTISQMTDLAASAQEMSDVFGASNTLNLLTKLIAGITT